SPFVFGVFRPVVIMPSHAVSKENVSYALMHELLHVERRDLLTKSIAEIVAILHWLNPAAWLIRNQINLACENACDEAVAERLDEQERKAYARAILDFMDVSVVP
ncbi:M56 family metallopeptidase, partial [Escherichia coli]